MVRSRLLHGRKEQTLPVALCAASSASPRLGPLLVSLLCAASLARARRGYAPGRECGCAWRGCAGRRARARMRRGYTRGTGTWQAWSLRAHTRARTHKHTNTQTHKRTNTHTGLEPEEAVLDYEKRAPLPVSLPPPPKARQRSRRGPSAAPRRRAETGEAGFEAAQAAQVVCRVEADQAHRGAGMWQPGDREGRVTLDRVGARRAGGAAERHLNVTTPALATSLFVTS